MDYETSNQIINVAFVSAILYCLYRAVGSLRKAPPKEQGETIPGIGKLPPGTRVLRLSVDELKYYGELLKNKRDALSDVDRNKAEHLVNAFEKKIPADQLESVKAIVVEMGMDR
jgi:hypothetical protein